MAQKKESNRAGPLILKLDARTIPGPEDRK